MGKLLPTNRRVAIVKSYMIWILNHGTSKKGGQDYEISQRRLTLIRKVHLLYGLSRNIPGSLTRRYKSELGKNIMVYEDRQYIGM